MSTNSNVRPLDANILRLVRYAMIMAMLVFVGVTYFVHSNAQPPVEPSQSLPTFRLIGFAMVAGAIVALAVLRGVRQRAPVERRGTLGLIGSAIAEGAGMFGGVYYFLGGGLDVFAAAIVVFLASWAVLPADPEAV
ncbi:MAG TPA: hypothetical protein VFJ16_11490 [Longimicrobium sp.]|nr:hypothetical protein [Longimicrobium sp.]